MKHSWRRIARLLALGLFALATAAWAYMLHASSCAGDIKGGHWGDPVLALEMESQAFAFGIVASCMLGAVLALSPKPRSAISRSLSFLAATVLCFIAIVVSGFFIDGQSVASCSPSTSRNGDPLVKVVNSGDGEFRGQYTQLPKIPGSDAVSSSPRAAVSRTQGR